MILDKIYSPDDLKNKSREELTAIAEEIRERMISVVSNTGGHLGAGLGVVELTLALHYVFNSPKDKMIWDVGHQAYAHKLVTGRNKDFDTIRTTDGMSGFLKRSESEHDVFGAGHASTSISAALGVRVADHMNNNNNKVIAVIGDGSMTGGMAYEALNNFRSNLNAAKNLIVVLNDNGMSISPNVGGLSSYLSRKLSGSFYARVLDALKAVLANRTVRFLKKIKYAVKTAWLQGEFFESLGLRYLGPIDGHNMEELIEVLQNLKDKQDVPVLLHVRTQKGRGYQPAEFFPERYHGVAKFDQKVGVVSKVKQGVQSFTELFGDALVEIAKKDEKVVAITAAMMSGTGLTKFASRFPERFYDVGIAEEHAVTFAAGLAAEGIKPAVAIYSTFMQRSIDQIMHDVCLQKLPVVFCLDRAGLVGADGPTHHGTFDISYLRMIPELVVMSPADGEELRNMLYSAFKYDKPVAIRYPRASVAIGDVSEDFKFIECGTHRELYRRVVQGSKLKVLLVSTGVQAEVAKKASEYLFLEGISVKAIDARFVKPIPKGVFDEIRNADLVFTLEENVSAGGFGSAILEELSRVDKKSLEKISIFGIEDKFVEQGDRSDLLDRVKLSESQILRGIMTRVIAFLIEHKQSENQTKETVLSSVEKFLDNEKRTH
jgi:1-deoxy-D-xylulose-5-phosphate synthase